ncbi:MAG: helix-turn-helix domain-containing protein [Sphingomonadales bacterium]|jgi:transcriptional regulator with XRE-family HTH domain
MNTPQEPNTTYRIAEKIRKLREIKGYKQETMAKRMGLTTNGYGKIERGESSITLDRLEQIAQVLEVSTLDILQFDDNFVYNITTMNNSATNGIVNNYSLSEAERILLMQQIEAMQRLIDNQNKLIESMVRK